MNRAGTGPSRTVAQPGSGGEGGSPTLALTNALCQPPNTKDRAVTSFPIFHEKYTCVPEVVLGSGLSYLIGGWVSRASVPQWKYQKKTELLSYGVASSSPF